MREIKFRAWDEENSEMFDWEYFLENCYSINELLHDPKLELMQYTGLKDKNGKEIYEGDIVKIYGSISTDDPAYGCYEPTYTAEIYGWGASFVSKEKDLEMGDTCQAELEVIGNIYENPDLLEAKDVRDKG